MMMTSVSSMEPATYKLTKTFVSYMNKNIFAHHGYRARRWEEPTHQATLSTDTTLIISRALFQIAARIFVTVQRRDNGNRTARLKTAVVSFPFTTRAT